MSRRHYILLAALVRRYADHLPALFVAELISMLQADNPHFDPQRFADACK